ncbi:glycosyltransferase family 2 protein [Candidatus Parcubacteria bacterium]|nr:glycosyltransferase family 2 protein [Candidatus Parcubacteria bacterium]
MKNRLTVPIAFIIFNRPDLTQKVFNEIRKAKPKQLFVIADGTKNDEEWKLCNQARDIINQVDWDCEVSKNYSDKNLGCKMRVSSGIDWFFDNVEEGIILEDDCIPNQTFFKYCQELLKKYDDDARIMHITGTNLQFGKKRGNASYYFSIYNHCWGWATWKRAWKHFDVEMKTFPEFKKQNGIKNIFNKKNEQKYWIDIFQKVYDEKINSWAYIWTYTCWLQKGITCLPNVNLISNIGFGQNSTHTNNKNHKAANITTKNLTLPLIHPEIISPNKKADKFTFDNIIYGQTIRQRIIRIIPFQLKKLIKKYLYHK